MSAYYNDCDPFKAAVMREAIKDGAIAAGDVDERSIADVRPAELMGYRQCHFFAGGGFWSLAARQAGWPDDRQLWTASLPCPSFSCAGKGSGFDDPRHLWPVFAPLIRECRPGVIVGEQADDAVGFGWLDLVSGDLEAEGYAVAAAVLGAHSVGAPHVRQRLYWCAIAADGDRRSGERGAQEGAGPDEIGRRRSASSGFAGNHRDTESGRLRMHGSTSGKGRHAALADAVGECAHADGRESRDGDLQRCGEHGLFAADRGVGELRHAECGAAERRGFDMGAASRSPESGAQEWERLRADDGADGESGNCHQPLGAGLEGRFGDVREWRGPGWLDPLTARSVAEAGATRGWWRDCDWWYGRDEKWRPIGPGLFPLAHGSSARVGRLRMYGDAICVPLAAAFIESVMEILEAF